MAVHQTWYSEAFASKDLISGYGIIKGIMNYRDRCFLDDIEEILKLSPLFKGSLLLQMQKKPDNQSNITKKSKYERTLIEHYWS